MDNSRESDEEFIKGMFGKFSNRNEAAVNEGVAIVSPYDMAYSSTADEDQSSQSED